MTWVKLKDRKPNEAIDGKKVLLFRITNETQRDQSISIFPTKMVENCNINETWWTHLPDEPNYK